MDERSQPDHIIVQVLSNQARAPQLWLCLLLATLGGSSLVGGPKPIYAFREIYLMWLWPVCGIFSQGYAGLVSVGQQAFVVWRILLFALAIFLGGLHPIRGSPLIFSIWEH